MKAERDFSVGDRVRFTVKGKKGAGPLAERAGAAKPPAAAAQAQPGPLQ